MEERIYNGYVYRRAGPGQEWQVVGPAGPQTPAKSQGRVFALPPDRLKEDENRRQNDEAARQEERLRLEREKFIADLQTKGFRIGADGNIEPIPGWHDPNKPPNSVETGKLQQVRAARQLLSQLDQQEELFRRSFMSNNLWNTLGEYNPLDPNVQNFNTYSRNLLPFVKQFMRVPGEGSQSDRDASAYQQLLPSSGVYDSTNIIRFNNIRAAANAVLRDNGQAEQPSRFFDANGGLIGSNAQPVNANPALAAGGGSGGAGGPGAPSGGPPVGPRGEPLLRPDQMVQFGTDSAPVTGKYLPPDQEAAVLAAARSGDVGQTAALLQRFTGVAPDRAQIATAISNYQKNPKRGISLGYGDVDAYAQSEADRKRYGGKLPQAMRERTNAGLDVWGRGLANGLTAGLGDYAAAGMNTLGGGSFADNLQMEQARTEADARLNPDTSMLSTVIGGAGGAALGEAALARMLPATLGKFAPILADTGYGATAGFASSDRGNEGSGTLGGALLGGLGGVAGRTATAGVGRAIQGVTDPSVQFLRDQGVRLTGGQLVGGALKRLEDTLTSVPFAGDAVRSLRAQGIGDFNKAAFSKQADTAGKLAKDSVGALGVEDAFDNASDAYSSALNGQVIPTDRQLVADAIPNLRLGATNAAYGDQFRNLMQTEVAPLAANIRQQITGQEYQDLDRALQGLEVAFNKRATGAVPEPIAAPVARAFGGLGDALDANIARNAPDILPGYMSAKQSYREAKVLQDAVHAARNGPRSGVVEQFMPSQLSDAAAANAKRFGGTQGTTNQPFYDLSRAGQRVLPSSVPDSGTPGRLLPYLALSGGYGADQGAGALGMDTGGSLGNAGLLIAALSAPNTKAGRFLLDKLLAARPDAVRKLGGAVGKAKRLGGVFGAGSGAALAPTYAPALLPSQ